MSSPLTPEEIAFVRGLVVREDDHILALNKPAGLSTQGGGILANTIDDLLNAFAKSNGKRPRLVHRLDRDTSGVLLTAKTQPAAAYLGKAMMARRFRKIYLAIVAPGAPEPRDGQIETALRRFEEGRQSYVRISPADHPDARAALTRYRTLAATPEAALMRLSPMTGRMHQLRVHLASIGRPIVGDARYGGALVLGGAAAPRLLLHAAELSFPYPDGGAVCHITAPPPEDFLEALRRLGIAAPPTAEAA